MVGTYSLVAILYFVCVVLTVLSCPEPPCKVVHKPIGEWRFYALKISALSRVRQKSWLPQARKGSEKKEIIILLGREFYYLHTVREALIIDAKETFVGECCFRGSLEHNPSCYRQGIKHRSFIAICSHLKMQ